MTLCSKRGLKTFSSLSIAALILASCSSSSSITTDSSSQAEESAPTQTTLPASNEVTDTSFLSEEERIEYINSNCDQIPDSYTAASARYDEAMKTALGKGFALAEEGLDAAFEPTYQKFYSAILEAEAYEDVDFELALGTLFADLSVPVGIVNTPVFLSVVVDDLANEYGPISVSSTFGTEAQEVNNPEVLEAEVYKVLAVLSNFSTIATNEASTTAQIEAASVVNKEAILTYIDLLVETLLSESYDKRHMILSEFTFLDLGDNPLNLAASLSAESCE